MCSVKEELSKLPKNAKYVIESSSVWYGMYRMLTDEMNLDVILSNPYANRLIAESKKTDRVDARILADLLRGGYISSAHVPSEKVVHNRQLVKYRSGIAHDITRFKNRIHGILLQEGTIMNSFPFTKSYIQELHELDDWRIDLHLKNIASVQESRAVANLKITQAVKEDLKAQLLATIPGVGEYTALTLSAAIDDVARFPDADHLISYFGLAPSVRNSANTTKYGSITKTGTSLVRKLLTECVIVHTSIMKRKDKNTPISEFYARLAKKRGTPKARVATAAKMIRIIYWMLKKKIDFETCVAEGRKSTARQPRKKSLGR